MVIDVSADAGAHPSHPINLSIAYIDDEIDDELLGVEEERAPGTDLWLSKSSAKKLATLLNKLAKDA